MPVSPHSLGTKSDMEPSPLPIPPDILLSIIEMTNVQTLLSLRLVSKSLFNLIASYEASISHALARPYWWISIFGHEPPSKTTKIINQLLQLQRLDLAREIGVHSELHPRLYSCLHTYFFELGSQLRRRLDHGLAIYDQYTTIKNEARAREHGKRTFGGLRHMFSSEMRKAIFVDRMSFMGLSATDILDYKLFHSFQTEGFMITYQHCEICHKRGLELDARAKKKAARGVAGKPTGPISWFTPSKRSNTTAYAADTDNEVPADTPSINSQSATDPIVERICSLPRQRGTIAELPEETKHHIQTLRPKEYSAAVAFLAEARAWARNSKTWRLFYVPGAR